MRLLLASTALAVAFVLTPVAGGYTPALCQDFSITNQVEPANPARRDLLRQLQAWWDAHAYYPRHASNNDESGTVKVHLVIRPDGKIWTIHVMESSGSPSLDTAGDSVFRGGSVRPFPDGEPKADIDVSLHYVLAHRHDQPMAAGSMPASSKRPFTVTNDPVRSPILDTMLQRSVQERWCWAEYQIILSTGCVLGLRQSFFASLMVPHGSSFMRGAIPASRPQVGKMVTWTGRQESFGPNLGNGAFWLQYTVWSDGDNHLSGAIGTRLIGPSGVPFNRNLAGNSVELTCSTDVLPTVTWNDGLAQSKVTSPVDLSSTDPP
jgi:TonB family protein